MQVCALVQIVTEMAFSSQSFYKGFCFVMLTVKSQMTVSSYSVGSRDLLIASITGHVLCAVTKWTEATARA